MNANLGLKNLQSYRYSYTFLGRTSFDGFRVFSDNNARIAVEHLDLCFGDPHLGNITLVHFASGRVVGIFDTKSRVWV